MDQAKPAPPIRYAVTWLILIVGIAVGFFATTAANVYGAPHRHLFEHIADYFLYGFGGGIGLAITLATVIKAIGWIDYMRNQVHSGGNSHDSR